MCIVFGKCAQIVQANVLRTIKNINVVNYSNIKLNSQTYILQVLYRKAY